MLGHTSKAFSIIALLAWASCIANPTPHPEKDKNTKQGGIDVVTQPPPGDPDPASPTENYTGGVDAAADAGVADETWDQNRGYADAVGTDDDDAGPPAASPDAGGGDAVDGDQDGVDAGPEDADDGGETSGDDDDQHEPTDGCFGGDYYG